MKAKIKVISKIPPVDLSPICWRQFEPSPVIGVDEVGRGCLAGPVFAAAVILPHDFDPEGITDSKLLSEIRREKVAERIHEFAQVGIGFASVSEIDRLNILQASFLAMVRAIENLGSGFGHVLVDGNQKIKNLEGYRQTTVVKGDLRVIPIGAASIVAKVARDSYMRKLAEKFPIYGFEKHKGYGSAVHTKALQENGPCVQHRSTFSGVRELWTPMLDDERALDPF
jgi:ribonuclease HII